MGSGSGYILKVEPKGFASLVYVKYERKRGAGDGSKIF